MAVSDSLIRHIYRVDLDLTGLCNRTCNFCPRTYKSYPNENKHMSLETIEIVMKELKSIKFKGWIELAGRGEPTLHPEFTKVVDMLTQEPRTWRVRVTTNGYRLKKHWDTTYKKIDELILNTYTNQEEYDQRVDTYKVLHKGARVEHYFKPDTNTVEEMNNLGWQKDTTADRGYFKYAFNNRAGIFSEKGIEGPCWHPMRQIFIDYNGNYQMCCNDWKYQIKIGNIHERSMIDMYKNDVKLNRIRWSLLRGHREDILPCKMCDDIQGTRESSVNTINKFLTTNEYKHHVCKIAGTIDNATRKELRGLDLIPVYQEE